MAKAKLKLSIAHQVPGRVRMKIPSAKGNPELLQQISETFAVIPGIEHVTANPLTGSVVLHYDVDRHHEFHGRLQPGARRRRRSTTSQTSFNKKQSIWPAPRTVPKRSWISARSLIAR